MCRLCPFRLERLWHERQRHRAARPRDLLAGQDYFIGFAYALGASFTAWALTRCISFRHARVGAGGAAVGGITLVGVLMAGGCFLIRCCGSPMLAVYMSLFGSRALGVGKPLTALVRASPENALSPSGTRGNTLYDQELTA